MSDLEDQLDRLQMRGPSPELQRRALDHAREQWDADEVSGTKFILRWAAAILILLGINGLCQHASVRGIPERISTPQVATMPLH